MKISDSDKERFLRKIVIAADGDCHEYQGAMILGYGVFWLNGKNVKAHRVAYVIANGEIPKGLQVNHHCDNRKCVNPKHLYAGTTQENVDDRERRHRGRRVFGQSHRNTTLSNEDVLLIRSLYSTGCYTQKEIAAKYSISDRTVGQIIRRDRWAHI